MAEIKLTKGKIAFIDDNDYASVAAFNWSASWTRPQEKGGKCYAARNVANRRGKKNAKQYLHRFLMSPPKGMVVDHINGNSLDNRRENLRIITQRENTTHCRFQRQPEITSPDTYLPEGV